MARRRTIGADDQLAIDETIIEDRDIEDALEERERLKGESAEHRLAYQQADKRAKGLLERLEMPDPESEEAPTVVRVARFRITKKLVKGRSVSFDTEDKVQTTIGLVDEAEPPRTGTEDQDAVNRIRESSSGPTPIGEVVEDLAPRLVN